MTEAPADAAAAVQLKWNADLPPYQGASLFQRVHAGSTPFRRGLNIRRASHVLLDRLADRARTCDRVISDVYLAPEGDAPVAIGRA